MISKISVSHAYEKYVRAPAQGTSVKHAFLFGSAVFILAFFTSCLAGLIPKNNLGFSTNFILVFAYFLGTYFMAFGLLIGCGCIIRSLDIRDYGFDSYTTEDGFGKPIVGRITCAVFIALSVFYFYNFWQLYHFFKLLMGH